MTHHRQHPHGRAPIDPTRAAPALRALQALVAMPSHAELTIGNNPLYLVMGKANVLVVLDNSNSMDEAASGAAVGSNHPDSKSEIARGVVRSLTDTYRMFEQPEKSYSWWDYRMLGFQKNRGLRIDHILVSEALRGTVTACHIDRLPRKNPQPSDHAPVVVTLGG